MHGQFQRGYLPEDSKSMTECNPRNNQRDFSMSVSVIRLLRSVASSIQVERSNDAENVSRIRLSADPRNLIE